MESGMQRCNQLTGMHAFGGQQTGRPVRRHASGHPIRWATLDDPETAQPEGSAIGLAETEARAIPVEAASSPPGSQLPVASEDGQTRLPRPVFWLAFAGWVVCCGMLFVSLVQREPVRGSDDAPADPPFLVATVSAALETVRGTFGDPKTPEEAERRSNGTAHPRSGR